MFVKLKFYYHIFRGTISRWFFVGKRFVRTESHVKDQYGQNYETETNHNFLFQKKKMLIDGKLAIWPVIEHKKFVLKKLSQKINAFSPESLLELGSGRGFNLLTLAVLLPNLKVIRGVELTPEGVRVAKENIISPPIEILSELIGFDQLEVRRRLLNRDIEVVEGSIRGLPFPDKTFDVVFSNSVIEQIPDDYLRVFRESFRVAIKGGVWSEPFREAQKNNLFKILYLGNIDYFRASYKTVSRAGWQIKDFEVPRIQKFVFNTGFLIAEKTGDNKIG